MVARVQGSEFSEFGMIHVDNNISQRLECKKKPSKTVQGARYRVKTLIYIYIYIYIYITSIRGKLTERGQNLYRLGSELCSDVENSLPSW